MLLVGGETGAAFLGDNLAADDKPFSTLMSFDPVIQLLGN